MSWENLSIKLEKILLSENFKILKCNTLETCLKNAGVLNVDLRKEITKYINGLDTVIFKNLIDNFNRENNLMIKTKRDFTRLIKTIEFDTDYTILYIICHVLKINIILLLHESLLIEMCAEYDTFILISNIDLIGLDIGFKVLTEFRKNQLPEQIHILLDNNKYLREQLKRIEIETLNDTISQLENNISRKLEPDEKKYIYKTLCKLC